MTETRDAGRIDKWLWVARFFKSRTLATRVVAEGRVRVNGERVTKAAQTVSVGDTLTFAQGRNVRVVRIEAIGSRRGPASEAKRLYTDMSPEPASRSERPERNERRKAIEAKRRPLE